MLYALVQKPWKKNRWWKNKGLACDAMGIVVGPSRLGDLSGLGFDPAEAWKEVIRRNLPVVYREETDEKMRGEASLMNCTQRDRCLRGGDDERRKFARKEENCKVGEAEEIPRLREYTEVANLTHQTPGWREMSLPGGVLLKGKADALVTTDDGEKYVVEHKSRMENLRGVGRKEKLQCIAYLKLYPECRGCILVETCAKSQQRRTHRVEEDELLWDLATRVLRVRVEALGKYASEPTRPPLCDFLDSLLDTEV